MALDGKSCWDLVGGVPLTPNKFQILPYPFKLNIMEINKKITEVYELLKDPLCQINGNPRRKCCRLHNFRMLPDTRFYTKKPLQNAARLVRTTLVKKKVAFSTLRVQELRNVLTEAVEGGWLTVSFR